jgi:hypothetical protein
VIYCFYCCREDLLLFLIKCRNQLVILKRSIHHQDPLSSAVEIGSKRLKSMQLRQYQERIINEALHQNTVVVLPTGSGKTLIASELILRKNCRTLFLVPTCLLVSQQASSIRSWCTDLQVDEYMGGLQLPTTVHILVSTPQAYLQAQIANEHIHPHTFGLVVFDEVHHVLKDHPYRKIARKLTEVTQVLGLTASLTYCIGETKVKQAIEVLCSEMHIQHMTTATIDELRAGGYHGSIATPEIIPTLEEDIPNSIIAGVVPPEQRQPHLLIGMFWERVNDNKLTGLCSSMMTIIRSMEAVIQAQDTTFKSPLNRKGKLSEWGKYAHNK